MHLVARLRALLARHPSLYWLVVAAAAALVADITVGKLRAVDETRRRWGESADVWVAREALSPGDPADSTLRRVPLAVVPDGALTDDPAGSTVLQRVGAGEILTTADVGAGVYALLPMHWQGVAFLADDTTIRVRVGEHVSVVADGAVVVDHAVVLEVAARSVTVGVPDALAADAALASRSGTAALTVRRPEGEDG